MKVGVYAGDRNLEAGAFSAGLEACGHRPLRRSASDYGPGQTEPFGVVVITGMRGKGRVIRDDYERIGVPVVVIDYGYLRRTSGVATWETGHWQVGVGGLNRPPSFECPDDRFDSLGIEVKARGKGKRPLVLGQHVGDPSHGLDAREMATWAQWLCDCHGARFRPHPDSPDLEVAAERAVGPLEAVLAESSVVHTLCSTAGLDAILAGVPAVATMPDRACWGVLSGVRLPSVARRRELCSRLAYGQWTLAEMRSGLAADFVMQNVGRWNA
jgi:hypothetical protein